MLRQTNATILLLEAAAAEVLLVQQGLASCQGDLHLAVVHDTVEAREWLDDTAERGYPIPRLILLDLKLPKLAGLGILRTLRMDTRLQDVPIVVFSESHEPSDVVLSYQIGANSFVSKPATLAEFIQLMREMSERGWLSARTAHEPCAQSL